MKLINKIIIIISIITILLFSYIGTVTEGATTLAQLYAQDSKTAAKTAGYSSGYAGSGAALENAGINVSSNSAIPAYESNSYDVEYHDTPEVILKESNSLLAFNEVMVFDPSLNRMVVLPYSEQAGSPIYYEPNSLPYGAKFYVPDYESSVYLSRSNKIVK